MNVLLTLAKVKCVPWTERRNWLHVIRNSNVNVEVDIILFSTDLESANSETFAFSAVLQFMMHLHLYRRCSVTY